MAGELDDLLPLFLDEAGARLDRLDALFEEAPNEPGAAVQVRRELHALKGASRLMDLTPVAELCHRAEDCIASDDAAGFHEARKLAAEVRDIVDDLRQRLVGAVPPTIGVSGNNAAPGPLIRGGSGELRVATTVVDVLAERSARMRVAARSAAATVQRLLVLSPEAERARAERPADEILFELAAALRRAAVELETTVKNLLRLSEDQLDATLRLQVQPLRPFLMTLARHTHELARSLGKEVRVTTSGGHVQLDRRILEAIREAALHLVHNAVDHGIENAEERRSAGKNPVGAIHLGAEADGDRVRLVVRDDGRGIDAEAVIRLAVERGLVNPAAASRLTPDEAYQLLELPGFTTRDLATSVSGRGIGLDAVAATFRSIGGDIWIRSEPGRGARVVGELPVARRGERVLVVRIGDTRIAIPSASVRSFSRLTAEAVIVEEGRRMIDLGDGRVGLVALTELFGGRLESRATVIETVAGGTPTGVAVDEIVGEEEVFVRPIPALAGALPIVEGIALLASGLPVAVLSLTRLGPLALGTADASPAKAMDQPSAFRILLTDDMPATREMMRRLLEDAGFTVVAVASGEEALARIEREPFDAVITGVELTGLSGIELTRRVRSSDLYADLPIVVVSTRDRPADRLAGLEAGADAYLTKRSLDPPQLVALIRRLTGD
ncbi:MAG: response regulator [Holophagae bacterium]|jgi:chemotaxis protein histidine kinase CheA/ActR/RegA family two-component response regulator